MAINALTARLDKLLAAAGHAGHASITYTQGTQATVLYRTGDNKSASTSLDLKGADLPVLATTISGTLLEQLQENRP